MPSAGALPADNFYAVRATKRCLLATFNARLCVLNVREQLPFLRVCQLRL